MKRTTYLLALIALGVLFAQPYQSALADNNANLWTGTGAVQICNKDNYSAQNPLWGKCVYTVANMLEGYIQGENIGYIVAYHKTTGKQPTQKPRAFCMPSGVSNKQVAVAFTKYLADHPKKLNQNVVMLLVESIFDAWPCSKGK